MNFSIKLWTYVTKLPPKALVVAMETFNTCAHVYHHPSVVCKFEKLRSHSWLSWKQFIVCQFSCPTTNRICKFEKFIPTVATSFSASHHVPNYDALPKAIWHTSFFGYVGIKWRRKRSRMKEEKYIEERRTKDKGWRWGARNVNYMDVNCVGS